MEVVKNRKVYILTNLPKYVNNKMPEITKKIIEYATSEDIAQYKTKIETEFEELKSSLNTGVDVEFKREAIGLVAAATFARELSIFLDCCKLLDRARNSNGSLNFESRTDLGLAMSAYFPDSQIDFLEYFKEPVLPYAREIKPSYSDYETFFKAWYATQTNNQKPYTISEQQKRELIKYGTESLESIVTLSKSNREIDDNLVCELKPVLISFLALSKAFNEFRVPKETISLLYSKISKFKSKKVIYGMHTLTRIFAEKIILTKLNEMTPSKNKTAKSIDYMPLTLEK